MTTTLRPAGPEERRPDGGRVREFAVRVNGREAGRLTLATDAVLGPATGVVQALEIAGPDRGRGRGAVAALAAEEVLRGWGCDRVRCQVPAGAEPALRLAASLGYRETNTRMTKALSGPPPAPPAGSAIRPMTAGDYRDWYEWSRAEYVQRWIDDGHTPERAAEIADASYSDLLPDGAATAGTALRVLAHDGTDVGHLWLRTATSAAHPLPYVFKVEVDPAHRGRGHGRTLMLAAEAECLAAGHDVIGLNVFSGNEPALGLYAALGYRPHLHVLAKPLV